MQQIAQAVDKLGYGGMLIGTGQKQDTWIVATSLISVTERLRFLVAFRPAIMSPSLAVRMAATFDQISNGRIILNVVTGGDTKELAKDGIFLDHDQRYELTDEFLTIWRSLMQGEEVTYSEWSPLASSRRKTPISSRTKALPYLIFWWFFGCCASSCSETY
ncbi:LLM class flavin-dependent oxidoreductase [Nostoc sp.]|uniref:LLM class flavin-dependent oxidoreductase n=1 Tax=Nostoc sp. TaxID=1180 RepID=UPI002FF9C9E8